MRRIGIRFLYIVDDDRIARSVAQTLLPQDGSTLVRGFASGVDFLREADHLDPGVVLLDLNMPEVDGNAVLEQLKVRDDGKFVTILVTAGASIRNIVLAMKYGAIDVIEKPFTADALQSALAAAFARQEAGTAAIAATRQARQKIDGLSPRERTVLGMLFEGKPNKLIAIALGISPRTVEIHRAALMRKLGVHDMAHAVRLVIVSGWVPDAAATPPPLAM